MCKTFIVVYTIYHMAYTKLCKESLGVIQIMRSFTNFKMVNTISISTVFWISLGAFTLVLFDQFNPFFLLIIWLLCSMMLVYLTLLSSSTDSPWFVLSLEQASLSLWGRCAAYFLEYSLSTLHYSEECLGPCNKHVFLHRSYFCS